MDLYAEKGLRCYDPSNRDVQLPTFSDNTRFVDSVEAIETQYPKDVDCGKTCKYVQVLKEHEEFQSFLDKKVLMEIVRLNYVAIQHVEKTTRHEAESVQ